MQNKKKICLIIPSLQAGGMERVMSELANYFSEKEEVEVHIILYGISRELFFTIRSNIIVHKPTFKFKNNLRLYYSIKTLFFLRKSVRSIDPRSILSFGEIWNSFVLLALVGLRYPIYISDRCQPDKEFGRFHEILRRLLYPKTAGIIAQTEKAREIIYHKYRHPNIAVIGNPIREIVREGSIVVENLILTVGRLIDTKHHDKLIEMFLQINKPGWKLIIIGYDHLKQNNSRRLNAIIEKHNAEDSVILEGKQSDVDFYYMKSSIFAFASSSEGFPNAIGEAMSAGLPVVAFDCVAGPSEMIENNLNGYLIPLFDFSQFREKLELLMNDPMLRVKFGKNARERIKEFSTKKVGEKTLNFILPDN